MIINGKGQPKLLVVDVEGGVTNPVRSITLPYCEKLTETFTPLYVKHRVQKGTKSDDRGFECSFRLDYSGFLDGTVLLDLSKALQEIAGVDDDERRLVLMPRIDVPERHFSVTFSKPFDVSMIAEASGHGDVVFEFDGADIEPSPRFVGTGYGTHYGGVNFDGSPSEGYGFQL